MAVPKFPELERQLLDQWREQHIFEQSLRPDAPLGRFVFFEGPPTANGVPHMGHVETRAFKDVILRYKTMRGYYVERKAGWDTQGLPVELAIEKQLGISGKKDIEAYGIEQFNAQARESVWKYKELWEAMSQRIGFWLDFSDPYITYTNDYIETLWWIFRQAWDQKLLTQDYKVVPYCPRCGTALSSHEVAQGYQEVTEPAVYVKFELVDEPKTFVLAWTTTPWTLPGNVALAVDEKIVYVKVKAANGEQVIVAKALLEKLAEGDREIVQELHGKDLIGKSYKPLFDFIDLGKEGDKKAYYIADADFVTTEDGTGVVHTAVMYGEDDFSLGKKLDLPRVHTVDETGRFNALVTPWVGLEVKDAGKKTQQAIIEWLSQHGQLYKVEDYTHDYPFCWRCKHPLLYYAKTSWFITMSQLRDQLMADNAKVNWYPKHIQEGRFGEWLREVKDWAISRERYWGTPLPIWQCDNPECRHQECLGSYADLIERTPTRNKYIFVRHGKSLNNEQGLVSSDPVTGQQYPLTPVGQKQAAELGKQLAALKPTKIFASEFLRTQQTAEAIAAACGLTVVTEPRIDEFRTGYDGKTHDEYHAYSATVDRFTQAPEGGETWEQLRGRMFSFLHEVDQQSEGETIVVVSHADPIMIVEWASLLQTKTQLVPRNWVEQGGYKELRLPMLLYRPDGSFDPHRPFIDQVMYPCTSCAGGTMKRVPEVADTWFDSGAMPFAQWHYPFENAARIDEGVSYPAHYITEAIDQTRGWFYTLLAVANILQVGKVVKQGPYENVVVLGHIRDKAGKKLSKSLGNYIDPLPLIEDKGADAVRFYLMTMNQPSEPKNFDPAGVDEVIKKTFLILMNVVSFWQLTKVPAPKKKQALDHPLDRWLSSLTNALITDVTTRLDVYDMTGAGRAIAAFITELSTWYVRRSRDRMKGEDAAVASGLLRQTLEIVAQLMAPFTPFLSDHIYQTVGGSAASVHLSTWPTPGPVYQQLLDDMAAVRQVVETGHGLRAKAGLKVRQPLQQVVVKPELRPELDEIIRDELNVKEVHTGRGLPDGTEWILGDDVALDVTVTDELKEEGMYRDIVREFNALRKSAKLQPSDRIIALCTVGTTAAKIIERFAQNFLTDVRADAVTPSLDGAEHTAEITVDGQAASIGLIVKR